MDYTKLQIWRVRAYTGGNRTVAFSFRIAAESGMVAEDKVRKHLCKMGWDFGFIVARPDGHVEFWN